MDLLEGCDPPPSRPTRSSQKADTGCACSRFAGSQNFSPLLADGTRAGWDVPVAIRLVLCWRSAWTIGPASALPSSKAVDVVPDVELGP